MGEKISYLAAAEIEICAPVVELLRVEFAVFSRAQKRLPIQSRRFVLEVGLAQVVAVAVPPGADERDLAEFVLVHVFALGFFIMLAAALLQADLRHSVV